MIRKFLRDNTKSCILFIGVFIIVLISNLPTDIFNLDNMWNFHMIQKINLGYIPYKEINVIITPLFHYIGALFLKIFGTNILSFYIYAGVINATLAVISYKILKKITEKKEFILLGMSIIIVLLQYLCVPNYNILIFIFPLLLILLEWKRDKLLADKNIKEEKKLDYVIGIILALGFLTKQTMGGVFGLAYGIYLLIYDKIKFGKIDWKSIIRKIIVALIAITPFVLYLLISDSFIAFIDLCFGGILDFGSKNNTGTLFVWPVGFIVCVSFFCFLWFKEKKDMKSLLIAIFSMVSIFMAIPLANSYHVTMATIISIFALIYGFNIIIENMRSEKSKLYLSVFSYIGGFVVFAMLILFGYSSICSYEPQKVSEELKIYYGLNITEDESNDVKNVIRYIKDKEQEGYNVYIMSAYASAFMIPLERNNYKYDLLLQGNMGFKGEERLIEEIKQIENPLFLKTDELIFQESVIVDEFIKENYKVIDKISEFTVYAK